MKHFPVAIALLFLINSGALGAEGNFTYEGFASCRQPPVTNFPFRATGRAVLARDRTAMMEIVGDTGSREVLEGKLGGPAVTSSGNKVKINVQKRNSLRIVRDFPNQTAIIDVKFAGRTCEISIREQLKPGRKEFTYPGDFGVAYCSRVTITKTSCVVTAD